MTLNKEIAMPTAPTKKDGPVYADPGYQKGGKPRYPIDTADHVRAAWAYINQAGNAARYSRAQLALIKGRIQGAAKRFGIDLEGEQAALVERLRSDYAIGNASSTGALDGEEAVHKPMKGKHLFISPAHLKDATATAGNYGPGKCVACGCDPTDADHDGDIDPPTGDPTQAARPKKIPVAAGEDPQQITYPFATTTMATGPITITSSSNGGPATATGVEIAPELDPARPVVPGLDIARAFLTEAGGRTLLTAPALTARPPEGGPSNPHFLRLQGRFVGAEKANRNGALWTTKDLELGQFSVANGPLNWLHEARHVIGSITSGQLITRNEQADAELAEPYIAATSAVWTWIYPDEAAVLEMASDQQKLWFSMECISKHVECVGEGGCGALVAYADYTGGSPKACTHMRERSATRRFAEPIFLGGATIVPPVRPGWAEADLRVLREAAQYAEQAFDQAGRPDIPTSEWEQLMAGVLAYAKGIPAT